VTSDEILEFSCFCITGRLKVPVPNMSEAADDVCREVGLGPKGNGGHFAPVRDSPAGTGLKNVIFLSTVFVY